MLFIQRQGKLKVESEGGCLFSWKLFDDYVTEEVYLRLDPMQY